MTLADFPLMHEWLNRSHVADWWDGRCSLEEVTADYSEYINSDKVFPFLVIYQGKPIGYIQKYDAFRAGEGWWPDEPDGTWGVDQFIGEDSLLEKGIGTAFIQEFTDQMFEDPRVKRIITDPAPENTRAIRVYEKTGFKVLRPIETLDGPAIFMEKLRK